MHWQKRRGGDEEKDGKPHQDTSLWWRVFLVGERGEGEDNRRTVDSLVGKRGGGFNDVRRGTQVHTVLEHETHLQHLRTGVECMSKRFTQMSTFLFFIRPHGGESSSWAMGQARSDVINLLINWSITNIMSVNVSFSYSLSWEAQEGGSRGT